jgi:predicted Fe-Mo cluster-binding NifX family protein
MKIAISSDGKGMDAYLDPAFGRCKYFVIYDTIENRYNIVPNPGFGASQGAGLTAVDLMKNLGVNQIITGRVGPKAIPLLKRAGISVSANRSGRIADILSEFRTASKPPRTENDSKSMTLEQINNPAGYCFCESCGYHRMGDAGAPCFKLRCPHCNRALERKYH